MEKAKFELKIENKKTSERAELIKFWVDNVKNKEGRSFRPAFIASKLSIFSIKDLYFLQSQALSDEKQFGRNIGNYFWSLFKIK